MKILCLGHVTYDISLPLSDFPSENSTYYLKETMETGGGSAANSAYLLGKWGLNYDTFFAGIIGNDNYGNTIKKQFNEIGLTTKYIETNYEIPTSLSLIIVNDQNGSRTLFNINKDIVTLKKFNLDFVPDIILTDGYDYNNSKIAIEKYPNSISIINANSYDDDTLELCKKVKYIISSVSFAEKITKQEFDFNNQKSLVDIYSAMTERFNKANIMITLGKQGVIYSADNNIKLMPAIDIIPKDTTGAKDIFIGAFLYGLSQNFDMEKCIKYANIAAGLSCLNISARNSIPTLDEVTKYYEEH